MSDPPSGAVPYLNFFSAKQPRTSPSPLVNKSCICKHFGQGRHKNHGANGTSYEARCLRDDLEERDVNREAKESYPRTALVGGRHDQFVLGAPLPFRQGRVFYCYPIKEWG